MKMHYVNHGKSLCFTDSTIQIYRSLGIWVHGVQTWHPMSEIGSCGTVDLMILGQFSDVCRPQGYGFHPIKNLRNCNHDFVAPFNSNVHNKTLCERGVMWIIRFVTYLSIAFHIYLLIIIHFQLIIITNVSILIDPAYFVPPSCHCGILALRSRDF